MEAYVRVQEYSLKILPWIFSGMHLVEVEEHEWPGHCGVAVPAMENRLLPHTMHLQVILHRIDTYEQI